MAKKYLKIGAAWQKSVKTQKGTFEFISMLMDGKGERDKFEVIIRDKSTQQEWRLADMGVSMSANKFKKSEKQPDYIINVSYDEAE